METRTLHQTYIVKKYKRKSCDADKYRRKAGYTNQLQEKS